MSVYDAYDFVVTPSSSKQQLWESTGEGRGVRPVRYTYENLKVEVFTRGGEKVGVVVGSASFKEGQRQRLRDVTCERDFSHLAARHPDIRGYFVVTFSFLEESVRGKGVGIAMYRVLAEHAGKQGLAVVPQYCWSGTPLTSDDALRVWGKLGREAGLDAEGHVVYMPPTRSNPRRRAPHPQVGTPAFQRWFGKSRVVDAKGEPLVMYHGTSVANFDAFSTLRPPFFTSDKNYAKMYSDKGKGGKAREIAVFLRIERPFDTRHDDQAVRLFNADFLPWYREQQQRYAHLRERDIPPAVLGEALPFPSADDFWRYLRIRSRRGDTPYDGLVVDEGSFPATWEEATERKLTPDAQHAWVPLDPTQIKSAKKNVGTFDPDDESILRNPRKKRVDPVLDPRHLALVETLAFKRWFRDSKVVDRLGRPLVVYHGSPDIRDVFGGMTTFRTPSAFFATDVYGVADTYARGKSAWDYQNAEPGVIPVFVSMQNPMVVDGRGARFRKTEHYVHQAYRDGHDGIIILNSVDDYRGAGGAGLATVYAWFDPRQAKSAVLDEMRSRIDGKALSFAMPNSGNFDPTNPDIRMNPRAPRSLPRMASLFSGGGLVEAGLVGLVEPVFAVDCDAHVASAYEAAHGAHICVADVCDVALPQRGTVDYLHASPVCKTSSLAKRGSKEESTEDMKTAQATADAIRALRPEIFTLENVPGYQKSASLGLITDALREEGYTFDAHVYDAADYGAPTHRTRLLLRAVREGELPSVPKPTHPVGGQADWYASVSDIIEAMPDTAIPKARKRAEDWMSLRLRAAGVDLSRLPRPLLVLGGSTGRGIPHVFAGSPAPTLKATTGEAHRIFLPDGRVKRLTPRGMARITGLPDDYPLPSAWGLAVKVIGNGVPPALARAIFGPLLQPAQAPHRPRSK